MKVEKQWGWYETLIDDPKLIVRKVCLNPNSTTPLQKETHVTKYWILIQGSGQICLGKPDKSTWSTKEGSTWKVHDEMLHKLSTEKDSLLYIEVICGNIEQNNTIILEV